MMNPDFFIRLLCGSPWRNGRGCSHLKGRR
nr:MAG TPA: hypothetical protein [Caudoviricetes sp.]